MSNVLDAAQKFHELNAAYELLLDPIRRTALDLKFKALQAKKIRYAAYDTKRKAMMDELEKSEREFKKSKTKERTEKNTRAQEEARIKEEGRHLMKERQDKINAQNQPRYTDLKGKAKEGTGPAGKMNHGDQIVPADIISPQPVHWITSLNSSTQP